LYGDVRLDRRSAVGLLSRSTVRSSARTYAPARPPARQPAGPGGGPAGCWSWRGFLEVGDLEPERASGAARKRLKRSAKGIWPVSLCPASCLWAGRTGAGTARRPEGIDCSSSRRNMVWIVLLSRLLRRPTGGQGRRGRACLCASRWRCGCGAARRRQASAGPSTPVTAVEAGARRPARPSTWRGAGTDPGRERDQHIHRHVEAPSRRRRRGVFPWMGATGLVCVRCGAR